MKKPTHETSVLFEISARVNNHMLIMVSNNDKCHAHVYEMSFGVRYKASRVRCGIKKRIFKKKNKKKKKSM